MVRSECEQCRPVVNELQGVGGNGDLEQRTQQPLWNKAFSRAKLEYLEGSQQASALGGTSTEMAEDRSKEVIFWQERRKGNHGGCGPQWPVL